MPAPYTDPEIAPAAGARHSLNAMAAGRFIIGPGHTPPIPAVSGFDIVRFIARGGSCHVWQAVRTEDGTSVALKIPGDDDPELGERLTVEAEALRSLQHPNIVSLLDQTVTSGERPVLVMEFVDGPNLAARLPADGFSFDEALRTMLPVLNAVAFAHSHGLVHRDLKPANILVAADGTPKVSDFGLARPVKDRLVAFSLTKTGSVAGTVEYLPPESYRPGYEPDATGDIYALGVLLYEMLTGTPPRGAWKPLSSFKKLDVRLDELISEAISPDPAQRLKSADLFRRRLETIRDSPPRFAGSALLTKPIRAIDSVWTIAGFYFLAAGFCSLEAINNTDMPDVFDLTFNHSRLLGGFWATWVLGTGMGLLWLWQTVRLWHFRRVPFIESLPTPFGLKMEPSRGNRAFTAVIQIFCAWLPVVFPILIAAQTWEWLTPETPIWQRALAITTWEDNEIVSMWKWDPLAFLDGGSYWIKEVQPKPFESSVFVHEKQSFLIFTQPLLLTGAGVFIATGMLFTLARLVADWYRVRLGRLSLFAALFATFVACLTADIEGALRERKAHKSASRFRADAIYEAVERESKSAVAELWETIFIKPNESEFLRALLKSALMPNVQFEGTWQRREEVVTALLDLQREASMQRQVVEHGLQLGGTGTAPNSFRQRIGFQCYAEPPDGPAAGRRCRLTVSGILPGPPDGFIDYWDLRVTTLYQAERRHLGESEAREWIGEFLTCLSSADCPDLELFFRDIVIRDEFGELPPAPCGRLGLSRDFRAERARWKSLSFFPSRELSTRRLHGARWELDLPLTQSGIRPNGTAGPSLSLVWKLQVVFSIPENRWQIHRITF
jgi:Protein kinase domain